MLDVRGTGRTGIEIADALRERYDAHVELATQATVVFVVGIAERPEALLRIAGDVEEVVGRLRRPGVETPPIRQPEGTPELAVSPREAFLGVTEVVAVDDAVGRISASRSPATRRASRRSCRASASASRSSRTCARASPRGCACTARATPHFRTMHVLAESRPKLRAEPECRRAPRRPTRRAAASNAVEAGRLAVECGKERHELRPVARRCASSANR